MTPRGLRSLAATTQLRGAGLPRRACIRLLGVMGAGLAALTTGGFDATKAAAAADASTVRLFSVVSPVDGRLLADLIPDFERQSGCRVALTTAEDVYGPARAGQVDLVLSHYGHSEVNDFVLAGLGHWPKIVVSNQLALLGPPGDPAQIRGLTDLVEAFRRIAEAELPFVVNDSEGVKYLGDILWNAAGRPTRGAWYVDQGPRQGAAISSAAERVGYTIWGLTPFLKAQQQTPVALEPLVLDDPLLQRIMVTVVVNARVVTGVNEQGALAFEQYLLTPATQARMRAVRVPGLDQQIWWPAGRNNEATALPRQA